MTDDARAGDGADDVLPNGESKRWWKEAVVYQIYPRSFNDSNGDGVGDIPGIVEKLDYLDELGVDVIWLNPVYESPHADNGYDIADYRSLSEEFGTMADWEELLAGLHDRDMRLIMDLVVNHTSDEHEWFERSRSSRDSEYRDYYIWREGRDVAELDSAGRRTASGDAAGVDGSVSAVGPEGEAPPNDWQSLFGGPAWTYDEETEEWYLHLFDRKQPDLNWRNEAVREDVYAMMDWWLRKGIDGFRMDVINLISKPEGLPNVGSETTTVERVANGPNVHEYISEMNDAVLDRGLLTVGEMVGPEMPMEEARRYVAPGPEGDGLSMLFHFEHVVLDRGEKMWDVAEWSLTDLKRVFDRWQKGLEAEGWNSLYLNNHDQPRMVSRFGDDGEYRRESAKLLGTLLHTLRGTPYVYQGEELGMTNYPFESLSEFRDVGTLNQVRPAIEAGEVASFEEVKRGLRNNSRDNARTPMQWTDRDHAGFTDGDPWIAVNPNYTRVNVQDERRDSESVWHYYRRLFELRSEHDTVAYGDYEPYLQDHERVWAYTRTLGDETLLVTLNFASEPVAFELPEGATGARPDVLLANYDVPDAQVDAASAGSFELRPWEARVYAL
ncbi:oligo-1,6-glucosidase [Halopelagius inordinatus]|uniref:Oligo-1,6-glucosidase n=1 Tax=Halopelagius inordinatus TaxID=553467 RepID=A0A1I2N8Q0_9EURY|nr:alpha-glucosidase [Halopelagius inordinatus]SFF99943.1 oligo-1,6-glucosidase [Halopelagius inordinatus]